MSRQIPLDQPLTDEDRAYLEERGRDDLIQRLDAEFGDHEPVAPNDSDLGTQHPAAQPTTVGETDPQVPAPTLSPTSGLSADQADGSADQGDGADRANYDDATAWSYEDLKAEVSERKESGAEGAPALNSSREVLVAWLFEDDAR